MRRKRAERERMRDWERAHTEREHTTCRSCGGLGALLLVASANWKPSVSTAQTSERRERALKAKAILLTLPLRFVCSHTNTRTHTYSQYINEFLTRRDFYFWILAGNNNNNNNKKYNYNRATTITTSEKSAAKQLEFWKSAQWVLVNVKVFCVCVSASTCLCVWICVCTSVCVCVSMTSLAYLLNWQTSLENKHTHKLSTEYWALILLYYLYYLVLETSFSVFLSLTLSLSLLVFYCRAQREIQLMFDIR